MKIIHSVTQLISSEVFVNTNEHSKQNIFNHLQIYLGVLRTIILKFQNCFVISNAFTMCKVKFSTTINSESHIVIRFNKWLLGSNHQVIMSFICFCNSIRSCSFTYICSTRLCSHTGAGQCFCIMSTKEQTPLQEFPIFYLFISGDPLIS